VDCEIDALSCAVVAPPHRITFEEKKDEGDFMPTIEPGLYEQVEKRAETEGKVKETLNEMVNRLVKAFNPERVILFGSYAYGKPTPDSDVDLLIIMESKLSPLERYIAVSKVLTPRVFPMDIIVRTPQEIEQRLRMGDFFIKEILERGKVLYERGSSRRVGKKS